MINLMERCIVCGGMLPVGMEHSKMCIKNAEQDNMNMFEDKRKELEEKLNALNEEANNKLKHDAIMDAIEATRDSYVEGGAKWLCPVERLESYAKKLLEK